jgi:hypothetical protein
MATAASVTSLVEGVAVDRFGFNSKPKNWNGAWVAWWFLSVPTVVVLAFHLEFLPWVGVAVGGLMVPEVFSVLKRDDSLPPLTHTIRHFLPNWLAFPLIYGIVGSVGSHWLGFDRPFGVGVLAALLGWLTDHFTLTYRGEDPYPYTRREARVTDEPPLPA